MKSKLNLFLILSILFLQNTPIAVAASKSFNCHAMLVDVNNMLWEKGDGITTAVKIDKEILNKKDGDYCQLAYHFFGYTAGKTTAEDTVKISYLLDPPGRVQVNEAEGFEVFSSDNSSFSGFTAKGLSYDQEAAYTGGYPYVIKIANYAKAAQITGNCLVEYTRISHYENNESRFNTKGEFRSEITSYHQDAIDRLYGTTGNWVVAGVLQSRELQDYCGGKPSTKGKSTRFDFIVSLVDHLRNLIRWIYIGSRRE